jgi:hypothetical protein
MNVLHKAIPCHDFNDGHSLFIRDSGVWHCWNVEGGKKGIHEDAPDVNGFFRRRGLDDDEVNLAYRLSS